MRFGVKYRILFAACPHFDSLELQEFFSEFLYVIAIYHDGVNLVAQDQYSVSKTVFSGRSQTVAFDIRIVTQKPSAAVIYL